MMYIMLTFQKIATPSKCFLSVVGRTFLTWSSSDTHNKYPINNSSLTNLTEIDMHNLAYRIFNKNIKGTSEETSESVYTMLTKFTNAQLEVIESELSHPKVQAIIKNETEYFDLIMIEVSLPAIFAFTDRFKCPYIVISSIDAVSSMLTAMGNPYNPVTNPDFIYPYNEVLTFKERIISVTGVFLFKFILYHFHSESQLIVKKNFGLDCSDMNTYLEKASMLFLNSDPVFSRVKPLLPNIIQFGGGTHIRPQRPLPKNLKTFLDSATEGFIYFSLGSTKCKCRHYIKSRDLLEKTRNTLIKTFSELPYKILWKFEDDKIIDLPDNVLIFKWTPQQDVLRHPNIKLFITQGGLQSLDESLHIHVPIVGLPFFADQPANIKRAVDKGMGLSADPFTLDTENFKNIILEVINNPKYLNRIKYLSDLIHDQPMTGLQKAIWWTKYVIRHKGAAHFRSPAIDIPFYQYYLLDVIGFYVTLIIIFIYVKFLVLKLLHKLLKFIVKPNSKLKSQ